MPLMRGTDGAGGCYTIPMGLCYGKRDPGTAGRASTTAPGGFSPLGAGGTTGCKSVTDLLRHSLAHRFSFISARASVRGPMERRASVSLWPACPVTVSQRRVAIEVAGLAVWAEALPETKLTDEQVPFPLSTPASAGRWIRAPSARIFPSACIHSLTLIRICPLCPPVDGVDRVDSGGQRVVSGRRNAMMSLKMFIFTSLN